MICILCAVDAGCGRQKRHGAEISFYALRENILSLHCIYVFTSHSFWFHKYYSLLLSILFIFLFRTVNACLNRIWRIVRDGLPFRCKQQKPRLRVRKLELHFFCSLVWLIPFWKARMQKKTYLIAAFDSVESFDFLIPFFQFNCVKETYRRKFCCILFFSFEDIRSWVFQSKFKGYWQTLYIQCRRGHISGKWQYELNINQRTRWQQFYVEYL